MRQENSTPWWRTAFEVVSTVLMVALAGAIVWQGRARSSGEPGAGPATSEFAIPGEPITITGDAIRGSYSAPVAIIEFADFECSYCARFAQDIEPALRNEYINTGRVLLAFKHFPLPNHKAAMVAAQAAWCGGRQSRFWEVHDRLFSLSGGLTAFSPADVGREVGLDMREYDACRHGEESAQAVRGDRDQGQRLGVRGTPYFFIGSVDPDRRVKVSHVLVGARSVEAFKAVLDRLTEPK